MGYQQNPDYITVAERIVEFRTKYPTGTLRPADMERPFWLETINGNPCFVVVAAAYRTPDDPLPGVGMAYEPIPGNTPYTRGSELQNAETAAWGRAIVATLAADTNRGIASFEEIRLQEERNKGQQQPVRQQQPASTPEQDEILAQWVAAVEDRAGDYQGLLALYSEAQSKRVPNEILALIRTAGEKAKVQSNG